MKQNWLFFSTACLAMLFLCPLNARADIFTGLEFEIPNQHVVGDVPETSQAALAPEISAEPTSPDTEPTDPDADIQESGEEKYLITDPADAIELERLYLDAATITKGYTVKDANGDFLAGVMPDAVNAPVTAVLKQIPAAHLPVEKTLEKISYIIEYDIRECLVESEKCRDQGEVFFENTKSLGELDKKIVVALKFDSGNYRKKILRYWDKPAQTWVSLPSTTDFENSLVRAEIQFPYARLAVFEDAHVQEGLASWYAFKDCHCAASHVYMRGAKLKVTNISGSIRHGRSVIVTVNDYGPDPAIHPDRPIDLDKTAYSALAASLGSGLMLVRVEPVDIAQAQIYEWVDWTNNKLAQN